MRLIDSHAHLTDERLAADAAAVIDRARTAGVEAIVSVASDLADSRAAVTLAESFPEVHAAVGIHPHGAESVPAEAFAALDALAREPGVVAIGETGLDYYYDNAPRDQQRAVFARQLELARRLALPVVVHSRNADADVAELLREAGAGVSGVLHCFTGGRTLLDTALQLGWYVSFAGMITFNNYADAELLRAVPLDRLLVETDSPYLAPKPHRGKRNEPAFVVHVARRAAALRSEDPVELASATARNTRALFRLNADAARDSPPASAP